MPGQPPKSSEALEASAEELYEYAPCAHLSTRPDGTIIRVNQTFLDWSGQTKDALIDRVRFQTLLTVGARIYYETHYSPLLQMQGFVNEIALRMRRADGTVCPVVASARQVKDAAGVPVVVRIALFDSTDRRKYERELLQARRQAEQAAQDLAQVDRRRNNFIAMLAHELRNPLAPIRSGVEILRRTGHPSQTVIATTEMLQRQVTQMARLVDDLLDVSRLGLDTFALRRVPVELSSVVHQALEMSEGPLKAAGLTFTSSLPTAPIYLEADASRLTQVIGNVLNNAAKFTPPGGAVSLVVALEEGEATIRIRDTGIGLTAESQLRVFDLFVQAASTVDRPDGLGIGLALAKSLVERHDGRIGVRSEGLGKGTEFTIHLPVLASEPDSVVRTHGPAPERPQVTRRVLVVDDNRDSAQMLAILLGLFGHETRTAHDGVEAVEAAAAFQPDIVLLDIGLPKLNGYEAA